MAGCSGAWSFSSDLLPSSVVLLASFVTGWAGAAGSSEFSRSSSWGWLWLPLDPNVCCFVRERRESLSSSSSFCLLTWRFALRGGSWLGTGLRLWSAKTHFILTSMRVLAHLVADGPFGSSLVLGRPSFSAEGCVPVISSVPGVCG